MNNQELPEFKDAEGNTVEWFYMDLESALNSQGLMPNIQIDPSSIDGKEMTFDKVDTSFAHAGGDRYERPIIVIPEITLGLRKLKDVKVAIVKSREKNTNVLLNRDVLSKLGYVVHPDHLHLLTKEMEKVKII